jgi:hypothetical protein
MSGVSLHRRRSREEVQQLLAWYNIRDMFFGENEVERDVKRALELAAVCDHPDAIWLTKLLAGHDVCTLDQARPFFLKCGQNDGKALGFAAFCCDGLNINESEEAALLRRGAEIGDAYSQGLMALSEEKFGWAQKAASQGERDGFYSVGWCFSVGEGCERNLQLAKEHYLIAAELGDVSAMREYSRLLDYLDLQRYVWLGRAFARVPLSKAVLLEFVSVLNENNLGAFGGARRGMFLYVIGRALKKHIDAESVEGIHIEGKAIEAVQFFQFQLQCARKAVDSWTVVGLRNKVVKDIRKLIGKMIWDAREEATYES